MTGSFLLTPQVQIKLKSNAHIRGPLGVKHVLYYKLQGEGYYAASIKTTDGLTQASPFALEKYEQNAQA